MLETVSRAFTGRTLVIGITAAISQNTENTGQTASREGMNRDAGQCSTKRGGWSHTHSACRTGRRENFFKIQTFWLMKEINSRGWHVVHRLTRDQLETSR